MAAKRYKVDMMVAVPKVVQTLLTEQHEKDIRSLKIIYSIATALPVQTAKKFGERYPDVKLMNIYASSELNIITKTVIVFDESNAENICVGVVAPGVTVKVVNVETREALGPEQRGEICVRSPALMKGYLGAPLPVDEQGFYPTGDLGYYDIKKRFYLVDRLTDVICYIGYMVSPGDIESVLLQHPAVSEAAVVGKPVGGEVVELPVGFVVLKPGAVATVDELQEYVDQRVSRYMQLRGGVRILHELPRNPRRKILRKRLRDILALE